MMASTAFLSGTRKLFEQYKSLGEKAIAQLNDEEISWRPDEASNSIAILVHHLSGNMLSRFTDFLSSDGEKPWRDREAEFETGYRDKAGLLRAWESGWKALFAALDSLTLSDLDTIVYIRNEGQSVQDALQRQLAHYSSHIGQIVYIAKMLRRDKWDSLSIPRGGSSEYNRKKFSQGKSAGQFQDKA